MPKLSDNQSFWEQLSGDDPDAFLKRAAERSEWSKRALQEYKAGGLTAPVKEWSANTADDWFEVVARHAERQSMSEAEIALRHYCDGDEPLHEEWARYGDCPECERGESIIANSDYLCVSCRYA